MLYNYSTNMLEYIFSKGWWGSDDWTLLEKKKSHTKLNGCHLTTDILLCFSGQYSLPFCDYPNLSSLSSNLWHPLPTAFSPDDFASNIRREFGFPVPQTHLYTRMSLSYQRLNLSSIVSIPSPLPLPELHTLSSLQTPTLLWSIRT